MTMKDEERQTNLIHSELWVKIFIEVSKLPRADVEGDAVDHPSLTTTLEKLFLKKVAQPLPALVTDEMIEKWVNENVEVKCHTATEEEAEMVKENTSWMRLGAKIGAKAHRDGLITK